MKQQSGFVWQPNKYYRSRPSLYQSLVLGNYLFDIDGTLLLAYQLNGILFKKSIQVLDKEEQFCAKIKVLNDKHLVVFGMYKFSVVSVEELKVVETVEISAMIEKVQARSNYISVLTSDEEGENKLLYCWKIGQEGKVEKKYQPVDVALLEYEECSDDRLELATIESIDHYPKIYLFWRDTNNMVQVDPVRNLEERYNRIKSLTFVTDIDEDLYSEISSNKITLCSKKGGKQIGSFTNEKEEFRKVISQNGSINDYYSISNQGVKKWRLENNAEPVFYAESDNYLVQNLYLSSEGELVGINTEKKTVLIWKTEKDVTIHNFPNQTIRKVLKVNDTQVCLMLEATISREVENQYQVQKHNKMQIYDFEKDREVAKKAVLKLQYKIDIDSSIVGSDGTILFILNEDSNNDLKKHIFKWSPFTEDKKEVKKREIVGAKNFDSIKLYPFDRIVTFKKAKESEMYDPFGKSPVPKSQVILFDCNAKKIGEYELSADIKQLQLSKNGQLYALGRDKFSIYEINANSKNRLQKIHELQITVSFVYPFEDYIIMKKESCVLIYDKDFELLMKEEEEEDVNDYRIMKVDDKKFVLGSKKEFSLWDLEREEKQRLKLEGWAPNLTELMGQRYLLIADKWIRSYDFQLLRE